MKITKRLMLRSYRIATRPYRWWWRSQAMRSGKVPIAILFYHRVADELHPWTLRYADFERQIYWLQANFQIISLEEAQRRIQSGTNYSPCVSITFDDGYSENCIQAIPLLLERQIPFTYFVTWSQVRDQTPFPHDLARNRPLAANTITAIQSLAELGVEIGSHTLSHPDFGKLNDPDAMRKEIVDSKSEIEAAIGRPVRYFAFPFGQKSNLTTAAFEMGKQAGYWGMCSAYGGYNEVGGDTFHLQRLHGDPSLDYLKNWLDFDPRVRRVRRFNYGSLRSGPTQPAAADKLVTLKSR